MSHISKNSELLYKRLMEFDQLCFDKCIRDPTKKLGTSDEYCLSKKIISFAKLITNY